MLPGIAQGRPSDKRIAAHAVAAMAKRGINGLAMAIVEGGRTKYVNSWGIRNARSEPLTPDTVMYGGLPDQSRVCLHGHATG